MVRDVKAESSLGCSDHGTVDSGFWKEKIRQKTGSQLWTLEEILAFSEIHLEERYGIWSWREKRSRKAGWFSRITSSKFKNGPSWPAENQAKVSGGLYGWTKSCWHLKYKEVVCEIWKQVQVIYKEYRDPVLVWGLEKRTCHCYLQKGVRQRISGATDWSLLSLWRWWRKSSW